MSATPPVDVVPRKSRKRQLLIGLFVLLLVLWFLPALIAFTPLVDSFVGKLGTNINGSVTARGASLGWFSPVVLHDFTVRDADGKPLVQVVKVTSERSLLNLLFDSSTAGTFNCDGASVDVVFAEDGSNLAKVFGRRKNAGKAAEPAHDRPAEAKAGRTYALDIKNAKINVHGRRSKQEWQATTKLSFAQGACTVESLRLETDGLACDASGKVTGIGTAPALEVAGQLAFDLEKLEPALRPYLGADVKAAGKEVRSFKLSGPLNAPADAGPKAGPTLALLTGEAGIGWEKLKAFGCDVGKADVRAKLDGGWLQLFPVETTVNGAPLRLEGKLRLEPEPRELHLAKGPVVQRAYLNPTMCASALGYAVPVLAGVTEAEGTVSLDLDGGRISLADPNGSELKGRLHLHEAKVGSSPLVRELAAKLRMPPPAVHIKDKEVPFEVTAGRVHHKNFELAFHDFTIRTSGSVGIDGSLDLLAEVPLQPLMAKLPGKLTTGATGKLLGAFGKLVVPKQAIALPIGGTLQHPRLDLQAMKKANRNMLPEVIDLLTHELLDKK